MKKQKKQLIVLVVALVLLVVGYIVAINKVNNVEVLDEISVISVIKSDSASVQNVSYIHDGVTINLSKENGSWVLTDDKEFELDEEVVNNIVNYASNLNARTQLEEPSELSEYGLDDPDYIVSFTDAQGVQQTYFIGDKFEVEGTYFAKVEGSDTIYTITDYYPNAFVTDKEQLRKKSE